MFTFEDETSSSDNESPNVNNARLTRGKNINVPEKGATIEEHREILRKFRKKAGLEQQSADNRQNKREFKFAVVEAEERQRKVQEESQRKERTEREFKEQQDRHHSAQAEHERRTKMLAEFAHNEASAKALIEKHYAYMPTITQSFRTLFRRLPWPFLLMPTQQDNVDKISLIYPVLKVAEHDDEPNLQFLNITNKNYFYQELVAIIATEQTLVAQGVIPLNKTWKFVDKAHCEGCYVTYKTIGDSTDIVVACRPIDGYSFPLVLSPDNRQINTIARKATDKGKEKITDSDAEVLEDGQRNFSLKDFYEKLKIMASLRDTDFITQRDLARDYDSLDLANSNHPYYRKPENQIYQAILTLKSKIAEQQHQKQIARFAKKKKIKELHQLQHEVTEIAATLYFIFDKLPVTDTVNLTHYWQILTAIATKIQKLRAITWAEKVVLEQLFPAVIAELGGDILSLDDKFQPEEGRGLRNLISDKLNTCLSEKTQWQISETRLHLPYLMADLHAKGVFSAGQSSGYDHFARNACYLTLKRRERHAKKLLPDLTDTWEQQITPLLRHVIGYNIFALEYDKHPLYQQTQQPIYQAIAQLSQQIKREASKQSLVFDNNDPWLFARSQAPETAEQRAFKNGIFQMADTLAAVLVALDAKGLFRQNTRVALLPDEQKDLLNKISQAEQNLIKIPVVWRLFATVLGGILGACAGLVLGTVVGLAIGGTLGSVTGPGALVTAVIGAGIAGVAGVVSGVTIGAAGGAWVGHRIYTKGLYFFKHPVEKAAQEVLQQAEKTVERSLKITH